MKSFISLRLALRIGSIIFILVVFFIAYNNFILDKSLAALDISLQSLKMGEATGVALLLNIDGVNEVIKSDFEVSRLAKLDYLGSTITERAATKDVQVILSNLIDEKNKQKAGLLKVMDFSTLAFNRGINDTSYSLAAKGKKQQLKDSLQEATDAHYKGEFQKAKSLYIAITKTAGAGYYGDVAKALLLNLNKQLMLKERESEVTIQLQRLTAPQQISNAYFELGLLQIQLLDFNKAIDSFNKLLQMAPVSDLATKAKFYLAWANKQAGNLDESIRHFEELINESKDEKFILSSRFQVADIIKRKGDFHKAAELFKDIAHKHSNSKIAPVSLMLSGYTYLFDLRDTERANEVMMELINSYPDSAMLESTRKTIRLEDSVLENLTKAKEELKGDALDRLWSTLPVLGQAIRLAEDSAAWYAVYMIEGSIDRAIQQNVNKDETLIIDVDPEFLTNYVRKGLNSAASAVGLSLSGFSLEFPKENHIRVGGFVKIGPKSFAFYALGKISFEKHIDMDLIKGAYNPEKWVIFTVLEGKLGPFNVPVGLANRTIGKAHRIFNQKQVFKIEKFSCAKEKIYFAGPVHFTQDELQRQRNMLDQYIRLYK